MARKRRFWVRRKVNCARNSPNERSIQFRVGIANWKALCCAASSNRSAAFWVSKSCATLESRAPQSKQCENAASKQNASHLEADLNVVASANKCAFEDASRDVPSEFNCHSNANAFRVRLEFVLASSDAISRAFAHSKRACFDRSLRVSKMENIPSCKIQSCKPSSSANLSQPGARVGVACAKTSFARLAARREIFERFSKVASNCKASGAA